MSKRIYILCSSLGDGAVCAKGDYQSGKPVAQLLILPWGRESDKLI